MAKVVVLLPRAEMLEQAQKIAPNYRLDFLYMKVITTSEAETEADNALRAGADVIIARGIQATLIKKRVSIPVVEMLLTGLEMGQLIVKAKALVTKPEPAIGVVSFANMICDLSSFDSLYEVRLREYYADRLETLIPAAMQAYEDEVDIVIGGEVVCEYAAEHDLPAVFLMAGTESIAEAFRIAERVSYAIDLEKKNSSELKTLLDHSFCGIIKIDSAGVILRANHFAETLLGESEQELAGRNISELVPSEVFEPVLLNKQEVYSTAFIVRQTAVVANIAPILIEERVQGAILAFNEGRKVAEMEQEIRREIYRKGYVPRQTFETFVAQSSESKALVARAKSYAKFNAPALILGQDSAENEMLAQCIHNDSTGRNDSFVTLSCTGLTHEEFVSTVFGAKGTGTEADQKGLVDWAEGGTLFLDKVSSLDANAQATLYQFMRDKAFVRRNDIWRLPANVRVIASDVPELGELVAEGKFRGDLYFALSVLPLVLTPLHKRPEDIKGWLDRNIREFEKKHQRYIRFTADAYKVLMDYHWNGGLTELYYFCERVAILSPRRTVNEEIICSFLNMSPAPGPAATAAQSEQTHVSSALESQLRAALQKHHWKRRAVAKELGISLSTLWRYMKKYGIYDAE
ncbi:MAG: sigma 54-interacting transcriptional regulator [Oscillospiraceae bacterium]|nr:sigma 54-interacting transcriptional regulator [Oscillospiraceae bacterium]